MLNIAPKYKIRETDLGPLISHSRVSVYDVMEAHDAGHDLYYICVNYNLTPLQVQIALDYIQSNRARLESELTEILRQKAENERFHRALIAERERITLPMTEKRQAFYNLRERLQRTGKI